MRGHPGRFGLRLLAAIVVVGVVAGAVIAAAFGDSGSSPMVDVDPRRASVTPVGTQALAPTADVAAASPTPVPDITGFAFPIEGACLPRDDSLVPGALREYRNAIHEGLDLYDSDNCTPIGLGTEVQAAKAGMVVRADWAYEGLTEETLADLEARIEREGTSNPAVEDAFRGRQVWIDHGDGVISRYAHLSAIVDGIVPGAAVEAGQLIAYVGDSGTPESVREPGTENHLHFEIRVGDAFLGEDESPEEVRRLYERAFAP